MNRRRNSESGSNSVEFALAIPVLALMILGSVDFCRAIWTNNTIAQAALDGARYASVRSVDSDEPSSTATVKSAVVDSAVGLDAGKVGVTTTWPAGNNQGAIVRVRVTYDFEPITPLLPIGSIALDSEAQLPIVN